MGRPAVSIILSEAVAGLAVAWPAAGSTWPNWRGGPGLCWRRPSGQQRWILAPQLFFANTEGKWRRRFSERRLDGEVDDDQRSGWRASQRKDRRRANLAGGHRSCPLTRRTSTTGRPGFRGCAGMARAPVGAPSTSTHRFGKPSACSGIAPEACKLSSPAVCGAGARTLSGCVSEPCGTGRWWRSVDEKSQIQAPGPALPSTSQPMRPGQVERQIQPRQCRATFSTNTGPIRQPWTPPPERCGASAAVLAPPVHGRRRLAFTARAIETRRLHNLDVPSGGDNYECPR